MDRDLIVRLREYEEFTKRETRFATQEEFLEFCENHYVYYPPDFGSYIQTMVTTDDEFIQFIQRVCIDDWYPDSGGLMWFVNKGFDEYVEFNGDMSNIENTEECDFDEDECDYSPTELVESYRADYNPYFDAPFSVIKDTPEHQKKIFKQGDIKVKPEISARMPFIARFVSHDTFDRMGSIKGNAFEIFSLNEMKPGKIMFV